MISTIHRWLAVPLVLPLTVAAAVISGPKQQTADGPLSTALNEIAVGAVQAIEKDSRHPARVVVLDFAEGTPSQLGLEVSNRFSSLLAAGRGFTVLSRATLPDLFARDKIPAAEFDNHEAMSCYATELGADTVVEGEIYVSSENIVVQSDVRLIKNHEMLFTKQSVAVPITPEIQSMLSMPRSSAAVPPDDYGKRTNTPRAKENGYSSPACLYCPQPQFTDPAVKARAEAKILLALEVDPSGHPSSVSVLRGAPCGLNERALDAARNWLLRPAEGPEGKPMAVWTPVEMTFHLY